MTPTPVIPPPPPPPQILGFFHLSVSISSGRAPPAAGSGARGLRVGPLWGHHKVVPGGGGRWGGGGEGRGGGGGGGGEAGGAAGEGQGQRHSHREKC
eukprot:COSAG02_NODE_3063_length_7441_cov_56.123944_1_plen_97_part_00